MNDQIKRLEHWFLSQRDISSSQIMAGFTLPVLIIFWIMPFVALLRPEWAALYDWSQVPIYQGVLGLVIVAQLAALAYALIHRRSKREIPWLTATIVASVLVGGMTLVLAYGYRDSPIFMTCLSSLVLIRALFRRYIYLPAVMTMIALMVIYEFAFWTQWHTPAQMLTGPIYLNAGLDPWWAFWLRVVYIAVATPTVCFFFIMGFFMRRERMRLEYMIVTDPLTGLANRHCFMNELRACTHRQQRDPEQGLALLMCDVDHFKQINDTWGHPVGDKVLEGVSEVLRSSIRAQTDVAARIGGEEFVVMLPGMSLKQARETAEKIRQRVNQYVYTSEGREFQVSISIGVALVENGDGDRGIRMADKLLYLAKSLGRNRVVVQRPHSQEGLQADYA